MINDVTKLDEIPKINGFWYLATPYSKYKDGKEEAFRKACVATGELMKAKVPIYSPIAQTHPVAIHAKIDQEDHDFWLTVDFHLLDAAGGLMVLLMDSWDESYGVEQEVLRSIKRGIPVIYMKDIFNE